jgi:hypothetical protein
MEMKLTLGTSVQPTSREALDELEDYVQCCLGGRIRDFGVLVQSGGLVLRGYTHSYHAKQLAQHRVMEVTDVPILANDIEVV